MSHQCRMDAQKSADQSLPGTASSPPHQPAAHIACPCCQSSEGFTRDHTNQFLFLIKPIPAVCWRKRGQKGLPYIMIFWKEAAGEDLHHVIGLWGKPEMKKAAHQSAKTPLQHRHASAYSQAGTRGDTLQNPNFPSAMRKRGARAKHSKQIPSYSIFAWSLPTWRSSNRLPQMKCWGKIKEPEK